VKAAQGFDDNILARNPIGTAVAGGLTGYALSRRAVGAAATGVRTTRAATGAVSAGGAAAARAPGQARVRATERSEEIRQRLRDARASAGRLRHPLSAGRSTRSAADDAADRGDWM
jgi:hypothetical protein